MASLTDSAQRATTTGVSLDCAATPAATSERNPDAEPPQASRTPTESFGNFISGKHWQDINGNRLVDFIDDEISRAGVMQAVKNFWCKLKGRKWTAASGKTSVYHKELRNYLESGPARKGKNTEVRIKSCRDDWQGSQCFERR